MQVPSTAALGFPSIVSLNPHSNLCEMGAVIIPIAQRRKQRLRQTGWVTGPSKAVVDPMFEPFARPRPKSPMTT